MPALAPAMWRTTCTADRGDQPQGQEVIQMQAGTGRLVLQIKYSREERKQLSLEGVLVGKQSCMGAAYAQL